MARLCANLASCHGDVCFSFAFRLITDADSNESYEPRPAWAKAGLSIPSLGVRESKQVDCYILSFLTTNYMEGEIKECSIYRDQTNDILCEFTVCEESKRLPEKEDDTQELELTDLLAISRSNLSDFNLIGEGIFTACRYNYSPIRSTLFIRTCAGFRAIWPGFQSNLAERCRGHGGRCQDDQGRLQREG